MNRIAANTFLGTGFALLLLSACSGEPEPVAESRYAGPDQLFQQLETNVGANPAFEVITEIDHSRLATEAGSSMPPAHVLIWSDPELEAAILAEAPLAAIDLPLRALAYESQDSGKAAVIANRYDFLVNRYGLPADGELRDRYEGAINSAMQGIPADAIANFPTDSMPDTGIITLNSPHDFATTEQRLMEAIDAQSDTVHFGIVDFAERSSEHGVTLPPMRMILFGGPGPGGKAMEAAPTLGLDAFCQKLLIWQDKEGNVRVSFNDLLALADRQQVSGGVALRVINWRLSSTFSKALEP
jgi:uncharacterized protein (DUF302 family)